MRSGKITRGLCAALTGAFIGLGAGTSAQAVEYLVNGDFETGDISGWTQAGDADDIADFTGVDNLFVHTGTYAFYAGPVNDWSSISQTLTGTTPGELLTVSGWYMLEEGVSPHRFEVSFNGVTLLSLSDSGNSGFPYTFFSDDVVALGNDVLTLSFHTPFSYFDVDDWSVTGDGAPNHVPLPAALPLFAAGLGALGLIAHRRTRKRAA